MTASHSRFPPSAAARWSRCPLSRAMAERYPEDESEAAREGTAAHWVAMLTLNGTPPAEGSIAPNGVEVTDEMLEGAELYADDTLGTVPSVVAEQPIACPSIHLECWGTPDARYAGNGVLFIWDYKFGHRPVDPFENLQLTCYASGVLQELDGIADQHTRVVFRIVQPRSYHRDGPVREWSCMASDLRPIINRLHVAAHAPPDRFEVTAECEFCPGRHACSALQYTALTHADAAGTGVATAELSPAEAALELRLLQRAAERITARVTGLEEQVTSLLRTGASVPGFALQSSAGRERWRSEPAEVVALGAMLGLDLAKPLAPVTPNQARKAGLPAEVAEAYTERPGGKLRLVQDDGSTARRIFGNG